MKGAGTLFQEGGQFSLSLSTNKTSGYPITHLPPQKSSQRGGCDQQLGVAEGCALYREEQGCVLQRNRRVHCSETGVCVRTVTSISGYCIETGVCTAVKRVCARTDTNSSEYCIETGVCTAEKQEMFTAVKQGFSSGIIRIAQSIERVCTAEKRGCALQ
jgi:hypothetical protein